MDDYLLSYTTSFFKETDIFLDNFIKKWKNNANEARFLPLEVRNNIKRMTTEQGLHSKIVIIRRKDLKITEANRNRNKAKFKFQGQYEILQRWFDLDFDCIEVNFSTRETDFYRRIFQGHDDTQDINKFQTF